MFFRRYFSKQMKTYVAMFPVYDKYVLFLRISFRTFDSVSKFTVLEYIYLYFYELDHNLKGFIQVSRINFTFLIKSSKYLVLLENHMYRKV